jgi:hypothetical protein
VRDAGRLWLPGLAGLVVWVFRRPLFEGAVLYKRDIHLVWQGQVETFVRAVASGSWPVWDPGLAGGQPLLADPSAQVAYPPTWLNLVLRPWTYYTLYGAGHVLFGGAGVYLLARRWSLSRQAAFVASALFLLSGPFLSLVDLWHHLGSAAWIPWVLLAADRALAAPGARGVLLWAGAMAGQILAGSADMAAMTGLAAGLLVLAPRVRWREPLGPTNRALALACLASVTLAALLTAVLWLPALDVASRSARWGLPAAIRLYWSVHPLSLADTLIPVPWRELPLEPALSSAMFEDREPFLASLYLGAASLALAGAGLALSPLPVKRVLAACGVLALLVALGRNAPFYDVLSLLLPPLRILRYPVKAMPFVAMCWALLAGLGFDAWRGMTAESRRRFLAGAAWPVAALALVALALVALARYGAALWGPLLLADGPLPAVESLRRLGWRFAVTATLAVVSTLLALSARPGARAARSAALVALLALLDLAALHRNIEPVAPRELYTYRPELLQQLGGVEPPRVYAYDYTTASPRYGKRDGLLKLARTPAGWDLGAAAALANQAALTPTTAERWGLDSAFEIDYRGLYSRHLARLTTRLRYLEGTPGHLRLLRLGGVTHVVALHREGLEDLTPQAELPGFYEAPIRVFRVPDPLPRTFVVSGVRVADGPAADELLLDPAFDPRREVVLPEGQDRRPGAAAAGTSRLVERRADRVALEVDLAEDGYVVLLDGYDPGWRARVDGKPSPVLRANVAFRAVRVGPGRHRVELAYRPRAVGLGLALSALSAAGAIAVACKAAA